MQTTSLPSSFDQLLQTSDRPVLVDFWADWCGPCHALAPTLKEVAGEFKGRMFVVKVNVDEKPAIAARYQISSIPTLILFSKGEILWRTSGVLPLHVLRTEIERRLST